MPPNPGPETVDYRVSRLIVLCKDCGDDVGLYPARHKCRAPERPPLPTLEVKDGQAAGEYATYWDMFKNTLWRTNAAVTSDNDTSTPGGEVWARVMDATTTVAKAVGVVADYESDSDVDENGETKLTRELKNYYTKQGRPIPKFLLTGDQLSPGDASYDGRPPRSRSYNSAEDGGGRGRLREREPPDGRRLRQESHDPGAGRMRMADQQKVPIPIRPRALRDEEDPQEMARRREEERQAAARSLDPREADGPPPRSRSYTPADDRGARGRSRDRERERGYSPYSPGEDEKYRPRQESRDPSAGRAPRRAPPPDNQNYPVPVRARRPPPPPDNQNYLAPVRGRPPPPRDQDDRMASRPDGPTWPTARSGPREANGYGGGRMDSRGATEERRYADRAAAFAALDGRVEPLGKSKRDYGEGSSRMRGAVGQRRDKSEPPPSRRPPSPQPRMQQQRRPPPPRARDGFGDSRYDPPPRIPAGYRRARP